MKKFYITTTLPYVNAKPHIGFALEIVQADVIARYKSQLGFDVFFNFGTDEHGQKIYKRALEEKKDPQDYVDEYAGKFGKLKSALNLSYNNFIRTTDSHHKKAAQEIWDRCLKNGYIEKGIYKAKYCVGCELEKQDSELVDGKCAIHPNLKIEIIDEENYFFKFSEFQKKLLDLYKKYPDFVSPEHRLKEIVNFVSSGLENFSVSRLKEKMPWGVAVPNDDKHVMYVWFDSLTNYISTLGWPDNQEKFEKFWGTKEKPNAIQVAGKDNLRQQTAMWQAMLLAAGLPSTKQIFIHGFITSGGQKMSKSLGNVIDPLEYVEKYGTDPLRYYLLAKINPTEDSDFTKAKFEEIYNADLANGLGNLVARVMQLAQVSLEKGTRPDPAKFPQEYTDAIQNFEFNQALGYIWNRIQLLDLKITESEPFRLLKTDPEVGKKIIFDLTQELYLIGRLLNPFLPETSVKIKEAVIANKKPESLFPRL